MTRIGTYTATATASLSTIVLTLLLLATTSTSFAFQSQPAFRISPSRSGRSSSPTTTTTTTSTTTTKHYALAETYSYLLQEYHYPTMCTTSGILAAVGDALAQSRASLRSSNNIQLDKERLAHFFLKGLGSGVIWDTWYAYSDQWTGDLTQQLLLGGGGGGGMAVDESTTTSTSLGQFTALRTALSIFGEECLACPIMYSIWDLPLLPLLQGQPIGSIPAQVQQKLPSLLIENAKVWSLVNILIYNIPLQYRVVVMSVAEVFWQSIVSEIASSSHLELERELEAVPLLKRDEEDDEQFSRTFVVASNGTLAVLM